MKISNNMSANFFLWQLRGMRIVAAAFLIAAVIFRRHSIDLAAFAVVLLIVSAVTAARRANYLLEVYDYGDYLECRLNDDAAVIRLSNIEKVNIRDGDDGLDWIKITLRQQSRFGKLIQFYPDMVRMPMGRPDLWVADMNARIAAARTRDATTISGPGVDIDRPAA